MSPNQTSKVTHLSLDASACACADCSQYMYSPKGDDHLRSSAMSANQTGKPEDDKVATHRIKCEQCDQDSVGAFRQAPEPPRLCIECEDRAVRLLPVLAPWRDEGEWDEGKWDECEDEEGDWKCWGCRFEGGQGHARMVLTNNGWGRRSFCRKCYLHRTVPPPHFECEWCNKSFAKGDIYGRVCLKCLQCTRYMERGVKYDEAKISLKDILDRIFADDRYSPSSFPKMLDPLLGRADGHEPQAAPSWRNRHTRPEFGDWYNRHTRPEFGDCPVPGMAICSGCLSVESYVRGNFFGSLCKCCAVSRAEGLFKPGELTTSIPDLLNLLFNFWDFTKSPRERGGEFYSSFPAICPRACCDELRFRLSEEILTSIQTLFVDDGPER
ncbi:hypothetical protein QBC39DRAFT_44526 [Podospora conica]|nr:hypothetical protein QBC39DRAFT_44526 [Schizothecium conicum]